MTTRRRRLFFCLFALSAGLVLSLPVLSEAKAETFMTVGDVAVDVTADNAAVARDRAIAQAQAKAFDRLVKRLAPNPSDQARIKPSQHDIESLVQDFAIENERVSPVRYIGLYSVRFRAGRVRKYLTDAGVTGVGDLQEVLIVPVYHGGNGGVLWGQGNPWRTAWQRGGFGDGPVSLILPNGDAFDSGTLSADAAETGDVTALSAEIQRYRVAGVVVASARPPDPAHAAAGLTVTLTTYDGNGLKGAQTLTVAPAPGEPPDRILLRGVTAAAEALQNGWKGGATGLAGYTAQQSAQSDDNQQPVAASPGTLYPVAVAVSGIDDWVRLRDTLASVGGVQRVSLDALTRDQAALTVDFAGDPLAFQAALAPTGYVLLQIAAADGAGQGTFQLRRGGPTDAAPPTPSVRP